MGGKFLVLSVNEPDAKVREYKRRKFHTKDRLGCTECRQKRVKVTLVNFDAVPSTYI